MSPEKSRIPLAAAQALADEVVELLGDWTERLAVAGSVRRGSPTCGDVELVCQPKTEVQTRVVDLFTTRAEEVDLLTQRCALLIEGGILQHRPDKNGRPSFGDRAKRLLYRGFPLDVFSARPDGGNWGVILLLRTGPSEWNQQLVLKQSQGGWLPRGLFFRDGQLWRLPPPFDASLVDQAVVVPTPEEHAVFEALGYAYVPPERRTGDHRPPLLSTQGVAR